MTDTSFRDVDPMDTPHHSTGESPMSVLVSSARRVREAVPSGLRAGGLLLLVAFAAAACRDPLNVPDPNSVQSSDLENPAAVASLVNGSLTNMNDMIGEVSAIYATASDEIRWIGSRDAWGSLSQGFVADPVNEFSDAAFPDVTQARFMADKAVAQAEALQGDLSDQTLVVRAYLYGAVTYATIADIYDDFVIPENRTDPTAMGSPLGEENMGTLYDRAISWLNSAESLARDLEEPELITRAIAYRARVRHARAVWNQLNPAGSTPGDPLVENQEMANDASTVLSRLGLQSDWSWEAQFTNASVGNNLAFQVNQRGELQFGPEYVAVDPDEETVIDSVVLEDPVTGDPSPVVQRKINTFESGAEFAPVDITSAREMHLLLAEHELAQGDTGGFETHINHVRTIAGQSDYTGGVPEMDMLEHMRQVHLLLMNRRLADMYRFGSTSQRWLPQSTANTEPGARIEHTG